MLDHLLVRAWFSVGIGITWRLSVPRRRSGRDRSVRVGMLRIEERWYVGHPNGEVDWTANLRAAGRACVSLVPQAPVKVVATPIESEPERTAAILVTVPRRSTPYPRCGPIVLLEPG